jgi:hypothetical protein
VNLVSEPPVLTPLDQSTPTSRSLVGWWPVGVVAIAAVVWLITSHPWQHPLAGHQVTYLISGDGAANNINYVVPGGSQQANDVMMPWSYSVGVRALGPGAVVTVVAQRKDGDGGLITCEIDVDGRAAVKNTSTGAYAVVTCTAPLS